MKRLVNNDPISHFEGISGLLEALARLLLITSTLLIAVPVYPIQECHITAPIRAPARVPEPVLPGVVPERLSAQHLFPRSLPPVVLLPQPPLLRFRAGFQLSVRQELPLVAQEQQAVAEPRFGS